MGHTSSSFLFRPVKVAPKKRGHISAGVSPDSTKLVKDVRTVSSLLLPNPAEPLGKDWMAWATSCFVIGNGGCRSFSRGGTGSMVSRWEAGCLASRAAIVASLCYTTESFRASQAYSTSKISPLQLCRDPGGQGTEWIRLVMGLT